MSRAAGSRVPADSQPALRVRVTDRVIDHLMERWGIEPSWPVENVRSLPDGPGRARVTLYGTVAGVPVSEEIVVVFDA